MARRHTQIDEYSSWYAESTATMVNANSILHHGH